MARVVAVLALVMAVPGLGFAQGATEAQIKAAFLFKFGGFIEWPTDALPGPDGSFTIGVMGSDAVADELDRLTQGRTVKGRPVSVRKLGRGDSLAGLQILFIGNAAVNRLNELTNLAKGRPLLIVTESDEALAGGSMINFVSASDHIRFDVALPHAERGQLKISARLLSVARKVITS